MSETHDVRVAKLKAQRISEMPEIKDTLPIPSDATIRRILSLAAKWEGEFSGKSLCNYIQEHFND